MATEKQKKLVKKLSANISSSETQTLKDIMLASGYSEEMAKTPSRALDSKGVIELFIAAGITKEKIAIKYNELLEMPLKEQSISADTRRKTLEDLSRRIIDNKEERIKPQIQFIEKFLNIRELKYNKPKGIETQIIEEEDEG